MLRAAYLDGQPWSQMAVLVRSTTHTLGVLRRAMMTAGVPVSVRGEDIPLAEQPAVAMLLTVLGCVLDPALLTEQVAEGLLVGPLGGGDSMLLRRLRRLLQRGFDGADATLVAALGDVPAAELLPERVRWPVVRVARVLAAGRARGRRRRRHRGRALGGVGGVRPCPQVGARQPGRRQQRRGG